MKYLLALLLCAGILWGCAQDIPSLGAASPEIVPIPTAFPEELYASGSLAEQRINGAVRAYPLELSNAFDLCRFGDDLLLFTGEETSLTLLDGENLTVCGTISLGFPLSTKDPSFQIHGSTLSYYNTKARETVVLDSHLDLVKRIAAPKDLSGVPLLSRNQRTVYYCTSQALCVWDLESGIQKILKEMSYDAQSVSGLHAGDTTVQCSADGRSLFIDADTGQLVREWEDTITVTTYGKTFFASFPMGFETGLVFGQEDRMQILLSERSGAEHHFLPSGGAAVSIYQPESTSILLDLYDISTGMRRSQLSLESGCFPQSVVWGADSALWLLMYDAGFKCDTLYRWDPDRMPINDGKDFTAPYLPAGSADTGLLSKCQEYAREIGKTYGIEILIGEDASEIHPWDYTLTPEIQPAVLLKELALLEQRLSAYPPGMLAATASTFASLKLCLVRSIKGTAESGNLQETTGVQFLDGKDAYVAVAVGRYAEQALYHELFHAMETHIFVNSIAFDQWNTLNPAGFQYDYSYSTNAVRDSGIYLHSETRTFVDTYSMSFPKEDRARIMEYAMLDGQRELFASKPMQAKLHALCTGLREAYNLEDAPGVFRWEQYLK